MTNAHIWEIGKPGKIQSTALGSQQAMNHTAAMLRGMGTDEAFVGYMLSALIELADQLEVMYAGTYAVLSDRQGESTKDA